MAREAFPARIISLLLSDVVNSPFEAIASGPTVPNPTDQADALAVLEKYDLLSLTPAGILRFLNKVDILDNFESFPEAEMLLVGRILSLLKPQRLKRRGRVLALRY